MSNNFDYITYLFLSKKRNIISVYKENNFEKVYEKEISINKFSNTINYQELDDFLNNNIFKIEKIIDKFIKKIVVILDLDQFFLVQLSIKKKNFDNLIDINNLTHLIKEAKESCEKTISGRSIVHLIIKNYKIDNKNYDSLPKNIDFKSFSIDLEFICLSNQIIRNLEQILNKYQISLTQVVNATYVREFCFNEENNNIFMMTKKILSGHNLNEVMMVDKSRKNLSFFEKFFNFFS